jgi:hypothetical protein
VQAQLGYGSWSKRAGTALPGFGFEDSATLSTDAPAGWVPVWGAGARSLASAVASNVTRCDAVGSTAVKAAHCLTLQVRAVHNSVASCRVWHCISAMLLLLLFRSSWNFNHAKNC